MTSDDDLAMIWNTFYHLYLDHASITFLGSQCRKLFQLSSSIDTWNQSHYATFIRICNVRTLSELHRHWGLHVAYADSPESKKPHVERIKPAVKESSRAYSDSVHLGATRSAGYYWLNALKMMPPSFTHFWNTGTTFTDSQEIENAKFFNPTFLLAEDEGFAVDQESDPMSAFHLATAFKDVQEEPVPLGAVFDCAKAQFKAWCAAFRVYIRKSPDGLIIRFFSGDPLAFCAALRDRSDPDPPPACAFTRPWSTCPLTLDGGDYDGGTRANAPLRFNVVETSNTMDSVGLLNLLVAVLPLISTSPSSAVFTETLAPPEADVIKWFASHFCGDIPTIGLIFDLVPTTYLSRITTRSDRGGALASRALDKTAGQYYERLVWKRPSVADSAVVATRSDKPPLLSFNTNQLAQFLLNVYLEMFALDSPNPASISSLPRYTRESFALFLRILRSVADVEWKPLMDRFYYALDADTSLLMGSNYYQDLWCQLHHYQLYTVSIMETPIRSEGLYAGWRAVPPVVTVFLVVPRGSLRPLEGMDLVQPKTPVLRCDVKSPSVHNAYPSIVAAFGSIRRSTKDGNPWIIWEKTLWDCSEIHLWLSLSTPQRGLLTRASLSPSPSVPHHTLRAGCRSWG